MTDRSVPETLRTELALRLTQAAKAADLLQSAALRVEPAPDETRADHAARLRGASVLAHTAALELAATSGWLEAYAVVERGAP